MTKEEIEKLVHCINALKHIREDDPKMVKLVYPGMEAIINEADKVLKNNPSIIPDWYKERIND